MCVVVMWRFGCAQVRVVTWSHHGCRGWAGQCVPPKKMRQCRGATKP